MSTANDPRQPSAAKPFVATATATQDLPIDYAGFIAVVFGIAGVMFKYKLSSWLALIFCAQSLSNMRNIETDLKQVSMAMMFQTAAIFLGQTDDWLFIATIFYFILGLMFGFSLFAVMGLVSNYLGPARPGAQG